MARLAPLPADQWDATVHPWSHHVPITERAGPPDEIASIRTGAAAGQTDAAAWDELNLRFSERESMDPVFVIGGYQLLAMAVDAFGVCEETL